MGERELREKYGGKLAKAINRAIRAELPEGNAALDRLAKLAGPAAHSGWNTPDGKPTDAAVLYHKHKRLVDQLEAQIRKKWDIPAAVSKAPKAKPKRRRSQAAKSPLYSRKK